jgi:hypothetical protein
MRPYSLSLYTPVTGPAPVFVASLTTAALGWRRTVRAVGGDWAGRFILAGEPAALQAAFDTWLGYHLVERVGAAVTWSGVVHALALSAWGMRRLRSLDRVANAVRAVYTPIGGGTAITAWNSSPLSIARCGRHEKSVIVHCPLASALIVRDKVLATNAWPWPRPTGSRAAAPATLAVEVRGYARTGNWQIATVADPAVDHAVSDWIAALIGASFGLSPAHGGAVAAAGDCQLLKTGAIHANPLQVSEVLLVEMRAFDLIRRLVAMGDTSSRPWQLQVDAERRVHYAPASLTPRYALRAGALYDSLSSPRPVLPWLVRPAVVRDYAYPVRRAEPGSFLADARDAYVDEVEVDDGKLVLKTSLFDEADLLAAQMDYLYP